LGLQFDRTLGLLDLLQIFAALGIPLKPSNAPNRQQSRAIAARSDAAPAALLLATGSTLALVLILLRLTSP
jgi:hypothetical protein